VPVDVVVVVVVVAVRSLHSSSCRCQVRSQCLLMRRWRANISSSFRTFQPGWVLPRPCRGSTATCPTAAFCTLSPLTYVVLC